MGRHHRQKWWLLSRSWGPSSTKPGAITTLFLAEIIYIQEFFCGTVSRKVIYRANIWSAHTKMDRHKLVDLLGGEDVTPIIKSSQDVDGSQKNQCLFSICPTL